MPNMHIYFDEEDQRQQFEDFIMSDDIDNCLESTILIKRATKNLEESEKRNLELREEINSLQKDKHYWQEKLIKLDYQIRNMPQWARFLYFLTGKLP